MRLLIFDNYDSFTYNLSHLVEKLLRCKVDVFQNDQLTLDEIAGYDSILLSPGPGLPEEAGLLMPLIHTFAGRKKILGICLGHQAIGLAFGARLHNLAHVFHGVETPLQIVEKQNPLFLTVPEETSTGRYHSWVIDPLSLPEDLIITATDEEGSIMGIRHRHHNIQGLQFHPESIMTPMGETMIANWLFHC